MKRAYVFSTRDRKHLDRQNSSCCGCMSDAARAGDIHTRSPRLSLRYRVILSLATALLSLLASTGCATSSQAEGAADDEESAQQQTSAAQEEPTSEELLFQAMVDEVRARDWEVATRSERFRTVATGWEKVSTRMRKRRIISMIVLPRGAAIDVRVEFQRNVGPVDEPRWESIESEALKRRANEEGIDVARAIEKRFQHMQ